MFERDLTRPYPGIRPFEYSDSEIFFGRETHVDRMLEILQRQHFVTVIGPSGSGKSSLVRAGLLPSLHLGVIAGWNECRVAVMRPGTRPIQRLANALLREEALGFELVGTDRLPKSERDTTLDVAVVEAELRRGPLGLVELVADARCKARNNRPFNLLLLVDQFEELFTYSNDSVQQAEESEAFVNLLLAAENIESNCIFIVLAMRTEFLGACVRFLDLPDTINRSLYLVPRLTRGQTAQAITGPARLFGAEVEPTLVSELTNAVGNNPDQLPILQHALARMWESAKHRDEAEPTITWADFNSIGGVRSALSNHADEIVSALGAEQEHIVERLFCAITDQINLASGAQFVRRPQSIAQIAHWAEIDWTDLIPLVQAFSQESNHLLGYSGVLCEDSLIDISHEALINHWDRLRGWVNIEGSRAGEFRRWRDRAELWRIGEAALLTGADLARAIEWRRGDANTGATFNRIPTAVWAARYGRLSGPQQEAEFTNLMRFLDESQKVNAQAERRDLRLKHLLIALTVYSLVLTLFIGILVFR